MENKKNRYVWVDLLRIFATWGVISIHGKMRYNFIFGDAHWIEYVLIGSIATDCVPLFLLLSGMLTLQHEVNIKSVITHKIPKVMGMKILSSSLCFIAGLLFSIYFSDKSYIMTAVTLWGYGTSFLAILLGCYLVAPFLSKIVEDIHMEKYFLILGAVFCFVIPVFIDIEYVQSIAPPILILIANFFDYAEVYIPTGAVYYFVLGHFLDKNADKVSAKKATVLYVVMLGVWLAQSFLSQANPDKYMWIKIFTYGRYYGSYVSPLLVCYASATFLFFRVIVSRLNFPIKAQSIIHHLGKNCMLIYLLHGVCINTIRPLFLRLWSPHSFLFETVVEVTVYFLLCYICSLILEKIPIIKRIM